MKAYSLSSQNISNYLSSGCVVHNITKNLNYFITLIPEIQSMIGFNHKHPHHHLDVWEHTLEVIRKLNTLDLELNTAALFHDIGKPFCYQEGEVRHFYGHPKVSEKIARQTLLKLEFDSDFIDRVSYLVKTHDTPINPKQLDNDLELIRKRLQLQYADAKSHHPAKVEQRIKKLDSIAHMLNIEI
ncbi:MAG: HD domain-containing protein [Clostridia bacterium]|nr:HD domain-containing protein [Clostridia bacterium]